MNNQNNTNEANNTQVVDVQAVEVQQPVQVQQPEKKKGGVKSVLKKVGIGLGVAAIAAVSAVSGFEVGKHSGNKDSNQGATDGSTQSE